MSNTPLMAWVKMVDPMLFIKHPNEGISYLLGFLKIMQYPFQNFKIHVIHPKTFLGYLKWGIASSMPLQWCS
jgi:hypothetical protein